MAATMGWCVPRETNVVRSEERHAEGGVVGDVINIYQLKGQRT